MIDIDAMWRSLDGARGILDSYRATQSEDAKKKLEAALKIVLDEAAAKISTETPAEDDE